MKWPAKTASCLHRRMWISPSNQSMSSIGKSSRLDAGILRMLMGVFHDWQGVWPLLPSLLVNNWTLDYLPPGWTRLDLRHQFATQQMRWTPSSVLMVPPQQQCKPLLVSLTFTLPKCSRRGRFLLTSCLSPLHACQGKLRDFLAVRAKAVVLQKDSPQPYKM